MSILGDEVDQVPMKLVFTLREELRSDPSRVEKTQALTLDGSRPSMGLRGKHGLFGSTAWWDAISSGAMPLLRLSGVVERVHAAGQDWDEVNTVDIRAADGALHSVGIYVNDPADLALFQAGHRVAVVYALDVMKLQPAPDGGVNVSKVALEMAVSLRPTNRDLLCH